MDVAENFPDECRYVPEMLGQVYGHDAEAHERGLTPDERLQLHQERSRPVMDKLHAWLEAQLAERKTEPNSGLGQAIGFPSEDAALKVMYLALRNLARKWNAVQGWKEALNRFALVWEARFPHQCA